MEERWRLYDQTNMTKHRLARLWGLAVSAVFRPGRSHRQILGRLRLASLEVEARRGAWMRPGFCGLLGRMDGWIDVCGGAWARYGKDRGRVDIRALIDPVQACASPFPRKWERLSHES